MDDKKDTLYIFTLHIRYGYKREIISETEYADGNDSIVNCIKDIENHHLSKLRDCSEYKITYEVYEDEKAGCKTVTHIPLYYVRDSGKILSDEEFLELCDNLYGIIPITNDHIREMIRARFCNDIFIVYPCDFTSKATLSFLNDPHRPRDNKCSATFDDGSWNDIDPTIYL